MASSTVFSLSFALLVPGVVFAKPLRGPPKLLKSSRFDRPMNVLLPLVLNNPALFVVVLLGSLACAANFAKLNWLTAEFEKFGVESEAAVAAEFCASAAKLGAVLPLNRLVVDLLSGVIGDGATDDALNVAGDTGDDDVFTPFSFEILNVIAVSFFGSPTVSVAASAAFGVPNPPNIFVAGEIGAVVVNEDDPKNGFDATKNEIHFRV